MAWENLPSTRTPLNATNLDKIVESGSNSNGSYIKYQDGTMIQWNYFTDNTIAIDSAYGSLYQTSFSCELPVAFVNEHPIGLCGQARWGTGASWGTISGISSTHISLRVLDVASRSSGTTVYVSWMAIGKWK